MVQKYATHTVVLHRALKKGGDLKRVNLPGGDVYEFSAAEVKEVNDTLPGTLIDPPKVGRGGNSGASVAPAEQVADLTDIGDDADDKADDDKADDDKDPDEL